MSYRGRELTAGNYLKLDDLQSQFNSSTTTFNLTSGGTAFYPGSAFSIQVVLGGVIQEPESAYTINQSQITFASAPGSGDDFFCIALGVSLGIGVPGEGTVTGTKLSKPFSYDDGLLVLDSTNNFIGINSTVPTKALDVNGNIAATYYYGNGSNLTGIANTANIVSTAITTGTLNTNTFTATGQSIINRVAISTVGVNTTLETGRIYVYFVGVTSLTLPPSPVVGDTLKIINRSGITTALILRNGSNIMGDADDLEFDELDGSFTFIFTNSSEGWTLG